MKILISGYDAFGGDSINPGYDAIKLLPNSIGDTKIIKYKMPSSFAQAMVCIEEAISIHKPDVFITVGQAGGRYGITIEKVGINIADARIRDNDGNQPIDEKIVEDGNAGYFSNLPIKAMIQSMRDVGIPVNISYTAGSFVCNYTLYCTLYLISKKYPNIRGGFIHVPFAPEQCVGRLVNTASMSIEDVAKGLEASLRVIAEGHDEIILSDGMES